MPKGTRTGTGTLIDVRLRWRPGQSNPDEVCGPTRRRSVARSWMGHSCLKRAYKHSFIRNPLTTKHFNTIFFRVSQTGETRKGPDGTGYRALAQDYERLLGH